MKTRKVFDMNAVSEGGTTGAKETRKVEINEVKPKEKEKGMGFKMKEGEQVNYADENGAIRTGVLIADVDEDSKSILITDSGDELQEIPIERVKGSPGSGNKIKKDVAEKAKAKMEKEVEHVEKKKEEAEAVKKEVDFKARFNKPQKKGDPEAVKVVARKEKGFLLIKVPLLEEPTLSVSKKNLIIASSRGDKETTLVHAGKKVMVGVNAYISTG